MSAPSGDEIKADEYPSPQRLNRKMNWVGTAEEAAVINRTYPGMDIFITTNDSAIAGFSPNTAYRRNATDTAWIVDTAGKHTHSQDTETAGGLLSDILLANAEKILWINHMSMVPGKFSQKLTLSGTITPDQSTGKILLSTGTTNGATSGVIEGGVRMDWARPCKFKVKGYLDANTYTTCRIGVGIENVADANQTTSMFGIEICDIVGTPRNWDLVSAANGVRSSVATSENALQTSDRAFRLEFTPGLSVKFYVNGSLVATKTTDIPSSGSSIIGNILQISIKCNETISKTLRLGGLSLIGSINDAGFV